MSKTRKNAIELSELVFRKVTETLLGMESGCYKIAAGIVSSPNPFTREKLVEDSFKVFMKAMLVNQYNIEYNSLANKDDFRIMQIYKNMTDTVDHSPLCLIHILFNISTILIENIDRSNLDTSSLEKYLKSLEAEYEPYVTKEQVETFSGMFLHKCEGPREAQPLPPGHQLFVIGNKPTLPMKSDITRCMVCGTETGKCCSGCKSEQGPKYYLCSRECQKRDWPIHPSSCKNKKPKVP